MKNVYIDELVEGETYVAIIKGILQECRISIGHYYFEAIESNGDNFMFWTDDAKKYEDFPEDLNALSVYFEVVYDEKKSKKR